METEFCLFFLNMTGTLSLHEVISADPKASLYLAVEKNGQEGKSIQEVRDEAPPPGSGGQASR